MKRNNKGQFVGKPLGAIVCRKTDGVYRNFIKIADNGGNGEGNYMLYARYLMQEKLGRELGIKEIVHHINEIPVDDYIENLKLMKNNEHISLHRKGKIPLIGIKAAQEFYKKRRKKLSLKVLGLFNKGYSLRKIAKKISVHRNTIRRIIKEEEVF